MHSNAIEPSAWEMPQTTVPCSPSFYVSWLCPQELRDRSLVPWYHSLKSKARPTNSQVESRLPACPSARCWPCVPPLFPHGSPSLTPSISTLSKPLTLSTGNSRGYNGSGCQGTGEAPSHSPRPSSPLLLPILSFHFSAWSKRRHFSSVFMQMTSPFCPSISLSSNTYQDFRTSGSQSVVLRQAA